MGARAGRRTPAPGSLSAATGHAREPDRATRAPGLVRGPRRAGGAGPRVFPGAADVRAALGPVAQRRGPRVRVGRGGAECIRHALISRGVPGVSRRRRADE